MIFVIDRIEENIAICEVLESNKKYEYELSLLPMGAKEGDVLVCENEKFFIDRNLTEKRKIEIKKIFDSLF